MARRDAALRLFVALYPDPEQAHAMLRAMRTLEPASHRATRPGQVHCTLLFLGERLAKDLDAVAESVERSASGVGPFDLTPTRLITLPERGRPRLVALETDAPPGVLEIHKRLVGRLASNPRDRKSQRFLPHFTLCRFTHRARPRRVDAAVEPGAVGGVVQVREIRLVRSVLKPEGAEHVDVQRFEL